MTVHSLPAASPASPPILSLPACFDAVPAADVAHAPQGPGQRTFFYGFVNTLAKGYNGVLKVPNSLPKGFGTEVGGGYNKVRITGLSPTMHGPAVFVLSHVRDPADAVVVGEALRARPDLTPVFLMGEGGFAPFFCKAAAPDYFAFVARPAARKENETEAEKLARHTHTINSLGEAFDKIYNGGRVGCIWADGTTNNDGREEVLERVTGLRGMSTKVTAGEGADAVVRVPVYFGAFNYDNVSHKKAAAFLNFAPEGGYLRTDASDADVSRGTQDVLVAHETLHMGSLVSAFLLRQRPRQISTDVIENLTQEIVERLQSTVPGLPIDPDLLTGAGRRKRARKAYGNIQAMGYLDRAGSVRGEKLVAVPDFSQRQPRPSKRTAHVHQSDPVGHAGVRELQRAEVVPAVGAIYADVFAKYAPDAAASAPASASASASAAS